MLPRLTNSQQPQQRRIDWAEDKSEAHAGVTSSKLISSMKKQGVVVKVLGRNSALNGVHADATQSHQPFKKV
jgi:hypothetical protein